MKRKEPQTRGGRISRKGFRIMWAGFALIIALLIAGITRASAPVIWALIGVMFALELVGFGIAVAGSVIDSRDLAEYHRKVAAGEIPPWTPGEQSRQS